MFRDFFGKEILSILMSHKGTGKCYLSCITSDLKLYYVRRKVVLRQTGSCITSDWKLHYVRLEVALRQTESVSRHTGSCITSNWKLYNVKLEVV